jgi:hypothetical protein
MMIIARRLRELLCATLALTACIVGSERDLHAQVAISEIQYDFVGADTGKQWVELRNLSDAEFFDLSGHYLYLAPNDFRFSNGVMIPAGGSVTVFLNRSGVDTASEVYTGIAGMRDLRAVDSLALYSTNLFFDSTRMLDFVQWGQAGSAVEFVAETAAIWTVGDAINVSGLRPGNSLAWNGDGDRAADWCVDGSPSQGDLNDECTAPHIVSAIRLNELDAQTLELTNVGSENESLNGYRLASGGAAASTFDFPSGIVISPGSLVLVHFGAGGTDEESHVYTGPVFMPVDLSQAGSIALFGATVSDDGSWLIDFLQWASAGQTFENLASGVAVWESGTAVDITDLTATGSLSSMGAGSGVDRWSVDNTPTLGGPNDVVVSSDLVINEIFVFPFGGGAQFVEIYNRGGTEVDMSGYGLCVEPASPEQDPSCFEMSAGTVLPSDQYLVIWLNRGGVNTGQVIFTGAFVNVAASGDAMALLASPNLSNANNFLDYVLWGSGGAVLETLAAGAGLWEVGDSVDVSAVSEGASLAYVGIGRGSDRYLIDTTPTVGSMNDVQGGETRFSRGDCVVDSLVDLTDAIHLLTFVLIGGVTIDCDDSCDFDDSATLDINDAITSLTYQFLGTFVRLPPIDCGPDPSADALGCDQYGACEQP